MTKLANSAVLQFGWSFEEVNRSGISDISQLFNSDEFKQYQEAKDSRFKALLKTIAGVNRI